MPLQMFKQNTSSASRTKVKHVIAVAAGKGGVGKSTVTVNLARALKMAGYSVGILDADIYGPSMRRMLPEDESPSQKGEDLMPAICQGIRMMSMAYFRRPDEATAVRAPIANGLIMQFVKNVNWGDLDYLLIDFPPGTGDAQLTLCQQGGLSGALIVTTPQELALMDVRKAANLFLQVKVPIVGVVENLSYYCPHEIDKKIYLFGQGGGARLALELGVPLLGEIPVDPEICSAGDEGRTLFLEAHSDKPRVKAFTTIAMNCVAHVESLRRLSTESLSSFELIWKEM